jgi:hypothetical protein
MRYSCKAKIEAFTRLNPNEVFRIIGEKDIEQIEYYIKNGLNIDLGLLGCNLSEFKSHTHFKPSE